MYAIPKPFVHHRLTSFQLIAVCIREGAAVCEEEHGHTIALRAQRELVVSRFVHIHVQCG